MKEDHNDIYTYIKRAWTEVHVRIISQGDSLTSNSLLIMLGSPITGDNVSPINCANVAAIGIGKS